MTDDDVATRRERLRAMKGRLRGAADAVAETRERLGGSDPDATPASPPPESAATPPAPSTGQVNEPATPASAGALAALLGMGAPGGPGGGLGGGPGMGFGGMGMGGLRRGARARARHMMARWLRSTLYETPDDGRGMVADTPVTQAGLSALLEVLHRRAASPGTPGARLVGQALTMLSEGGDDDSEIVQGIKVTQFKKLLALLEGAGGAAARRPGAPMGGDRANPGEEPFGPG